jgi:2-polyprenyl-6-methoxyphenol hydroxylase-like FAD-dependent oxidoreductase
VLAGELCNCGKDYAAAFARYQDLMMPFLKRKQKSAAKFASAFAPKTAFGLAFRNFITRLFRIPFVAEFFLGRELRDEIELPDYQF